MGAQESVSVLKEGDLCAWKDLVLIVVMRCDSGYVLVKYQRLEGKAIAHTSIHEKNLVLIDPVLYPMYGYERKDDEGVARNY